MQRPVIGITMGDAAGIGPEITVKLLANGDVYRISKPLVIGDRKVLQNVLDKAGSRLSLNVISNPGEARFIWGVIDVLDMDNIDIENLQMGHVDKMCGRAAVEYVKEAVKLVKARKIQAILTAPLCKESMHQAGLRYGGHTELLAHLAKTKDVVMMIAGGALRTVLATRHLPIKKVSPSIKTSEIVRLLQITDKSFKKFLGIKKPKIVVSSLNPHGGEGGLLGSEEKKIIIPAVKQASKKNINVSGPLPPDVAIYEAARGRFDVAVVMYHDQALVPVKLLAFHNSINVTLGLPFVRTSPCHGTAFDIAGKGLADARSMMEALKMAVHMTLKR
ncbi:MAG: 4-hydroxythreonine-4-phosphate dehydrogenase PdxA [bacterium]